MNILLKSIKEENINLINHIKLSNASVYILFQLSDIFERIDLETLKYDPEFFFKEYLSSISVLPIKEQQKILNKDKKWLKLISIEIESFSFEDISFNYQNINIERQQYPFYFHFLKEITFVKCKFSIKKMFELKTPHSFKNCTFLYLWNQEYFFKPNIFEECIFHNNLIIGSEDFELKTKVIYLNEKNVGNVKNILIKNAKIKEYLSIENNCSLKIEKSKIYRIHLRNIQNVIFLKTKIKFLNFLPRSIGKKNYLNNSLYIYFLESEIKKINICCENIEEIKFVSSVCERFFILKTNVKEIIFLDCIINKSLEVKECQIGKIDLSDIQNIEFINFYKTTVLEGNLETYRLIKKSFEEIGNIIESNIFFEKEMKEYEKELSKSKRRFQEKIAFKFNKWVSTFGQNYIKPFLLFILLSIIYYFYLNINHFHMGLLFDINKKIVDIIPYNISKILKKGFELESLIYYIFSTIFIWHFIVAFKRKTLRK